MSILRTLKYNLSIFRGFSEGQFTSTRKSTIYCIESILSADGFCFALKP